MVDRHYDDEALISFLESAASAATDPHLAACGDCRETLETLQALATTMQDEAVWQPPADSAPNPRTIATLRAFADQMDREDAAAEELLPALIAAPRESWAARVAQNPAYRTAGMVRRLLAAADRAIDTMPPDAVALTALATTIADRIEVSGYESDAVAKLRGAAWRDHAYALYYTGSFSEAEKAVLVSESHFSDCVVGEYESGRSSIVRALILRDMDRLQEGMRVASAGLASLEPFGDASRSASAAMASAQLFAQAGDHQAALRTYRNALKQSLPDDTRARLLANIAYCSNELGNHEAALRYFREAMDIYLELRVVSECARTRWNIARTELAAGHRVAALRGLRAAVAEFETLAMTSEATVASLDVAEVLLSDERYAEVERICTGAMQRLAAAGLSYTSRALTALAYLQEAVMQRREAERALAHVRSYVTRLPRQPQLLFAAPPD